MFEEMNEILTKLGVIPVVVINDADNAEPLGKALMEAGMHVAEITFRTDAAEESIKRIRAAFPEMLVGAGTVLSVEQADKAIAAGAKFIVMPGFDPEVVDHCISLGVPVYPAVATPTEAMMGMKRGLKLMKFFPAEQLGGVTTIKAICAALKGIRFMPTGGINRDNLATYLECPQVALAGGSWMVKSSLIEAGDFETITQLCRRALTIAEVSRRDIS